MSKKSFEPFQFEELTLLKKISIYYLNQTFKNEVQGIEERADSTVLIMNCLEFKLLKSYHKKLELFSLPTSLSFKYKTALEK